MTFPPCQNLSGSKVETGPSRFNPESGCRKMFGYFATDGRNRPERTDLGTSMSVLAMLGGCLNRKHDGPLGMKTVWTGHMRLAAAAQACERKVRAGTRSELYKKLRAD